MTVEPHGSIVGALPATSKGFAGEVRKILFSANAAATGIVSVQSGGVTIKQFNTPTATGALDHPLMIGGEGDMLDPTVYTIVGSPGCFVTYWVA